MFRLAEMILHERRSTSYDLATLLPGKRNTLDRCSEEIAERISARLSAQHATVHLWRTFRKYASFLMLASSKIEEVSHHWFVF